MRHGDKGKWSVDRDELQQSLPPDEVELIMSVLHEEFADARETPLKKEGLIKSLRAADWLYKHLPINGVLVASDSGKDRARLTREIITARLAQLEAKDKQEHGSAGKRIDILAIDAKEITHLLADAHESTWTPYGEMMKNEGISESEAISRWLVYMNDPKAVIDPHVSPQEAAERYRTFMRLVGGSITSENAPVIILGVGHSGSLGQIRYEETGGPVAPSETPQFCDIYEFDAKGKLKKVIGVKI